MLQTSKAHLPQKSINKDHNDDILDVENQNLFDTIERAVNDDAVDAINHMDDKNPILNKRILLKVNFEPSNNIESDFVPLDPDDGVPNQDDSIQTLNEVKSKIYKTDSLATSDLDKGDSVYDRAQNEKIIYDHMKAMHQYQAAAAAAALQNGEGGNQNPASDHKQSNEGRIVVYGDSNCLDSTHIEKPCFWLLDALLEYTMSSHVSTILKDLNRLQSIRFGAAGMPKRLPNNNLHMYSKVLQRAPANNDANSGGVSDGSTKPSPLLKRKIPKCDRLHWETPIFLNISAPSDFHLLNGRNKDDTDADGANVVGELNLRRKLESQKGEVCSVAIKALVRLCFVSVFFFVRNSICKYFTAIFEMRIDVETFLSM